jgi:hypothetical protein
VFTTFYQLPLSCKQCIQFTTSHPCSLRSLSISHSHLRLSSQNRFSFFPSEFLTPFYLLQIRVILPYHFCSLTVQHLVNSVNYKAPHYENFSCFCLLPLSSVEILYLAICSHIRNAYVKGHVSHLHEKLLVWHLKESVRDKMKIITGKQNCCLCGMRSSDGSENVGWGLTACDVV